MKMFNCGSISLVFCLLFGVLNWTTTEAAEDDKTISLPLKSTHNGQLFYVELEIGQGDTSKVYNMLVSTSYPVTWIPSLKTDPIRGYDNKTQDEFDNAKHYLRLTGCQYASTNLYVHYNWMRVGSMKLDRQAFGVTYETDYNRGMVANVDGMLGLNDEYSYPLKVDYLFNSLVKSNRIDHQMYSLYINNSATNWMNDNSEPAGTLLLGGIDNKYYTGDFNYVKLHEDYYFESEGYTTICIYNIELDWSRTNQEKTKPLVELYNEEKKYSRMPPTRLKLDSSTILYVGEKRILDKFHLELIGAKAIVDKSVYAFNDCHLDSKPDFVFYLKDGPEVRITPEEYVVQYELDGRRVCLSAFKFCRRNQWLFGTKFLRKYYTLFDYENGVVGFAKPT